MKKFTKKAKIITAIVAVALVVGGLALASQSELLQGRFLLFKKPVVTSTKYPALYMYKDKIVSAVTTPVTSPVPSVVVSDVTSPAGTSSVASVVVSAVTSPVASAVPVERAKGATVDAKKLKTLTASILRSIEREDYKNNKAKYELASIKYYNQNPAKFVLTKEQTKKLIDLYKKGNPAKFIFRPVTR